MMFFMEALGENENDNRLTFGYVDCCLSSASVIIKFLQTLEKEEREESAEFENVKPATVGRQRSSDVICQKPGLSRYSKNVSSPKEAFALFVTDEMMLYILEHTNKKIQETLDKFKESLKDMLD